jgi:hypothetical protein
MVTCSEITNTTRIATRDGTQLEFRTLLDPDYARLDRLVRTLRSSRGSSEERVRLERTRERERELAIEILFEELRSLLMEITKDNRINILLEVIDELWSNIKSNSYSDGCATEAREQIQGASLQATAGFDFVINLVFLWFIF